MVYALQIPLLRFLRGNLDGKVRGATDCWHQKYQDRQQMSANSRPFVSMPPMTLIVRVGNAFAKRTIGFVVGMSGELVPVEHNFCFRERRNEAAYRCTVTAQSGMRPPEHLVDVEAVSADESLFQKFSRHPEADAFQISGRRKGQVRELINIKGEFGTDVGVRALAISDRVPELLLELGEPKSGCGIDGLRVSDRIAQIVG